MPNILQKLLPKLSGDSAEACIADLRERHRTAAAVVDKVRAAYENTLQKVVAGERPLDDVAKAREALTAAEQAADLLADAANVADQQRAKAEAAAVVDRAWSSTLDASREREAIADRLQAQLADVAASYAELCGANASVHRSLPVGFPFHAAAGFGIEADLAPSLVRVEFSRRGLPGGPDLLGGEPQLLADRYKGATRCIEHARAASQVAAANG